MYRNSHNNQRKATRTSRIELIEQVHGPKALGLILKGPRGRFVQLHYRSPRTKPFETKASRIDWPKYKGMTLLDVVTQAVTSTGRIEAVAAA